MCGITGIINRQNASDLVSKMTDCLHHRGPDAQAVWNNQDNSISLGHARLSIIDTSTGANQPFCKHEFTLVFNGEIYNYRELRYELALLNVTFTTHSDTEVLLEAWRQWGKECLNKLRGMFAFAIYDQTTHDVFVVRDHFGIKPLFYSYNQNTLAFASELKALEPSRYTQIGRAHV